MSLNCYNCRLTGLAADLDENTAVYIVATLGKRRLCLQCKAGHTLSCALVQGTQMIGDLWAPESGKTNKKILVQGMGSEKGASFEREIGGDISMWISGGTRNDLFRRTVLSGGQWTSSSLSSSFSQRGEPGDIGANNPLAFAFLDKFVIECKHWATLDLDYFIWGKEMLWKAMNKVMYEADTCGKHWLLIARQNYRPTLVFFAAPSDPGPVALISWHALFAGTVYLCRWADVITKVNPTAFLRMYDSIDEDDNKHESNRGDSRPTLGRFPA